MRDKDVHSVFDPGPFDDSVDSQRRLAGMNSPTLLVETRQGFQTGQKKTLRSAKRASDAVAKSTTTSQVQEESDIELLNMILSDGNSTRSRDPLIARLLAHYGSLAKVIAAPTGELCKFGGLTNSDVLRLRATHTAAVRLLRRNVDNRPILRNWTNVEKYLVAALSWERRELLKILFLDLKYRVISDEIVSQGTLNHLPVYPREIVKRAIETDSSNVIIVHNHPSGDALPSYDDVSMTKQLIAILGALSILVLDHVIVASGAVLSMRATGILQFPSTTPTNWTE